MFKKTLKVSFILGCIVAVSGLASWLVAKNIATSLAQKKAQQLTQKTMESPSPADTPTPDEKVTAIASHIFKTFHHKAPATVPLLRVRGYLTNRRLPDFLRLESGVIETLLETGMCDNASRMLAFVLKQESFESVQWNMVTPQGAHSALLVTMPDNRKVLVDPYYGYVTVDKQGNLISPQQAHDLIMAREPLEAVFKPLGENSDIGFYTNFRDAFMAAEGDPLLIEATIPDFNNELVLGKLDGNDTDVKSAGTQYHMTYAWHYAGHLYNREWVRVLKTDKPVRVVMTLVSNVEDGVVTAEPKPEIKGKDMIWDLEAGDKITFYDGRAKVSPARLNSFIGVDRIAFTHP